MDPLSNVKNEISIMNHKLSALSTYINSQLLELKHYLELMLQEIIESKKITRTYSKKPKIDTELNPPPSIPTTPSTVTTQIPLLNAYEGIENQEKPKAKKVGRKKIFRENQDFGKRLVRTKTLTPSGIAFAKEFEDGPKKRQRK
ncbi:hypothetical protein RB653_003851 [Dictyostelium firmibasis]|uniref:Uncharacterized protein n=1 Tax=Dictyostelium firmibasis TaxID=79012 RepID=A0AAN7U8R5_9MYCE